MSISVVIGAASTASFGGACVISANWSQDPGRQDAFCLGSWDPSKEHIVYKPQQTLSLTVYASSDQVYDTSPSESCTDIQTITASVNPQTCDGSIGTIEGPWYVNSYSYSKEAADQPAQETWSFIKYDGSFLTGTVNIVTPTYVIKGISQGQCTDENLTGVRFKAGSTFAQSSSGSVSAGSQGKVTTLTHGIVEKVGGANNDMGLSATGSASITLTPLYI